MLLIWASLKLCPFAFAVFAGLRNMRSVKIMYCFTKYSGTGTKSPDRSLKQQLIHIVNVKHCGWAFKYLKKNVMRCWRSSSETIFNIEEFQISG